MHAMRMGRFSFGILPQTEAGEFEVTHAWPSHALQANGGALVVAG